MAHHATLLYNNGGYVGHDWEPGLRRPVPGLNSSFNRAFWGGWDELKDPSERDFYSWEHVDNWVAGNEKQGLKSCLCLNSFPGWGEYAQGGSPSPVRKAQLRDLWYRFVWSVAERYGARIAAYQGPIEYDDHRSPFYNQPWEVAPYMRSAHDAISAASPGSIFIAGSVQSIGYGGQGLRDLRRMLEGWGNDGMPNAIGLHLYVSPDEIPRVAAWIENARGVVRAFSGGEKTQMWVDEWGVSGLDSMAALPQGRYTRAILRQFEAAWVTESMLWAADEVLGARLKRIWNDSLRRL